ncbi:hypothetical protein [Chroococcidiopsis sp.]|uniref:hypothetical protein n=1 Tax=Chroococcidiopsis sp. TaxID=3088168 RepID=UPI003F2ADC62
MLINSSLYIMIHILRSVNHTGVDLRKYLPQLSVGSRGRELRELREQLQIQNSRIQNCPTPTPYTLSSRNTHHSFTNYQLPTTNYQSSLITDN